VLLEIYNKPEMEKLPSFPKLAMYLIPNKRVELNKIAESVLERLLEVFNHTPDVAGADYDHLVPVVDFKTGARHIFEDKTFKKLDIHIDTIEKGLPGELRKVIIARTMHAEVGYNPRKPLGLSFVEDPTKYGKPYNYINRYVRPDHLTPPFEEKPCPKYFKMFLDHLLVGSEECRHNFLCWLKWVLFSKNETALFLIGKNAIGKSYLCELIENLVGASNHVVAHDAFLNSNFNAILENNQVIVAEERSINRAEFEKIKKYTNPKAVLEKKGKDAVDETELCFNLIVTNNYCAKIKIESTRERRAFVPDLTETPLPVRFKGKEEVLERMWEVKDNSRFLRNVACFLYHYDTKELTVHSMPYKGETFQEIIVKSLQYWKRDLYYKLLKKTQEYYDVNTWLSFSQQGRSVDETSASEVAEIEDFLSEITYNGLPLGHIEERSDGTWVVPNEQLKQDVPEELR
jgi:hypothetical protein